MSSQRLSLTGKRFGAITVLSYAGKDNFQNSLWAVRCDCGQEAVRRGSDLSRGRTTNCGCVGRSVRANAVRVHGFSADRLHRIWRQMLARTENPNSASYPNYGGRGISVCAAWRNDFLTFRGWALSNGYDPALSIDRINNDADYSPANCRWATPKEQAANRRARSCFRKPKDQTMKTFRKIAAQGEIVTDIVDRLPEGVTLKKVEPINGRLIVSHSESGHDHYIPAADADLFERADNVPSGMRILYSIVKNPTALKQSAAVPHGEIALEAKIYRHRIAREFDPFAEQARRVAD